MNTAFLDALNLAWKIHAVEAGFANRNVLETYEPERKDVAETLLSFDNKYAKLFSQRPPAANEVAAASAGAVAGQEQNEFINTFKESCEFTSGYGVFYKANALNWSPSHPAQSHVVHPKSTRLVPGRILVNADVTRVVDANVVHLEQEIPLNGSFRLFVFAGKPSVTGQALRDLAANMAKKNSFYMSYARPDLERVSHHERHNPHSHFFSVCTVFAAAHAKMGLDQEKGGVVVVRPDGYVGVVVALEEGSATVDALNQYFGSFCTKKLGGSQAQL